MINVMLLCAPSNTNSSINVMTKFYITSEDFASNTSLGAYEAESPVVMDSCLMKVAWPVVRPPLCVSVWKCIFAPQAAAS